MQNLMFQTPEDLRKILISDTELIEILKTTDCDFDFFWTLIPLEDRKPREDFVEINKQIVLLKLLLLYLIKGYTLGAGILPPAALPSENRITKTKEEVLKLLEKHGLTGNKINEFSNLSARMCFISDLYKK